jgi:predicted small secreted protein
MKKLTDEEMGVLFGLAIATIIEEIVVKDKNAKKMGKLLKDVLKKSINKQEPEDINFEEIK